MPPSVRTPTRPKLARISLLVLETLPANSEPLNWTPPVPSLPTRIFADDWATARMPSADYTLWKVIILEMTRGVFTQTTLYQ